MQKQLFANDMVQSVEVRGYNDGEYWNLRILVTHYDEFRGVHDVWEYAEWTHYTYHNEESERFNEENLAEFKAKFNLK